ncbi:unnamed protein product [Moneuplotes crassus]|uniref:Glycoside hydrolase family 2 catalytic domain-containing protein n=1 Tax=Euplotes crassus TaxID=5936 RepID=A0AAD2D1B2_EUPCR|nr:unnamed protein product [Moneuplotes crassus]
MEVEYSALDQEIQKLQSKGQYKKILRIYERVIHEQIERNLVSQEMKKKACDTCNILAIQHLKKKEYDLCLPYLKKAEKYIDGDDETKALTYNNLACYYRDKGQLRGALVYLLKVQKLEKEPIISCMNTGVVLSQLGRHEEAKDNIMKAIMIIQDSILNAFLPKMNKKRKKVGENVDDLERDFKEKAANLSMCYRNLAIQNEFLKDYESAIEAYRNSKNVALDYLGEADEFSIQAVNTYKTMRRAIQEKTTKLVEKNKKREKIRPLIEKSLKSQKHKARNSSADILKRGFRFKSAGRKRRPGTKG